MTHPLPLALALLALAAAGCKTERVPAKPDTGSGASTPAPATAAAPGGKQAAPEARVVPAAAVEAQGSGTTPALSASAVERDGTTAAPAALGPGLSRLPSGIEYEVVKPGDGPSPVIGSKVLVHFSATIDQGKKVLDTWKSNVPREFTLDSRSLIRGWIDALLGMKKGERRKLKVPSALAYGAVGYPPLIPPNQDVVFELELVNFTPPAAR